MQVGDGTTTVTLLASEFLKQVKPFIEEGVHAQVAVKSFRKAANLVSECYYGKLNSEMRYNNIVQGRRGFVVNVGTFFGIQFPKVRKHNFAFLLKYF